MSSSSRFAALRMVAGAALIGAFVLPGVAQAKLLEPTFAGPLSNGSFSGLPIRADVAGQQARQPVEVVGENCYVLQHQARSADGRVVARRVPVCE